MSTRASQSQHSTNGRKPAPTIPDGHTYAWHWALRDIPPFARLILHYLDWRAGTKGECWPKVTTMGAELGIHPREVKRALRELRERGLLTVSAMEDDRRRNVYRLSGEEEYAAQKNRGHIPPYLGDSFPPKKGGDHAQRTTIIEPYPSPVFHAQQARPLGEEKGAGKTQDDGAWAAMAAANAKWGFCAQCGCKPCGCTQGAS